MPIKPHGYLIPDEIDPQRIRLCIEIPNEQKHLMAFWGALEELGKWFNWERDEEKRGVEVARVWQDVWRKARESFDLGECASDDPCQEYSPKSPRLTWFPENPYNPNNTIPEGYLFHPFTVVDGSILSTIISQFGLGYEIGDVYTDLTKLPPGDWGELLEDGWRFFPGFRINNLNGSGTVKLHLLNIPQGGRALIVKDGVLNILAPQLVELNKDIISIPNETQTPIVIEVKFDTEEVHTLDVAFVPNVNDEPIPFFHGGGIRKFELCGFGLEGCDDMVNDPCCPDENEISYAVYRQTQINYQQFLRMMDDGDTAASFGAPPTFDGDASPNRQYALCRTINRLIQSAFNDAAMAMGAASDVITTIGRIFPSAQPISGMLSIAAHVLGDVHLRQLAQECDAIRSVACCLRESLEGQNTTIDNLQGALGGCGFDFGTPEAEISAMVNNILQNRDNARAFIAVMNEDYESAGLGGGASAQDCDCECDCTGMFEIVATNDCIVTPLGDCQWRIYQPVGVIGGGDPFCPDGYRYFTASFQASSGECIDIIGGSGTATSSYVQINCDGTEISGVGGGGGQGKHFTWQSKACDPDPTVLDIIITVAPVG